MAQLAASPVVGAMAGPAFFHMGLHQATVCPWGGLGLPGAALGIFGAFELEVDQGNEEGEWTESHR